MNNTETLNKAFELLKSINCPCLIMDALWLFSLTVHDDDIKLKNWNAWSKGNSIEGEITEIMPATTLRLPDP